LQVVRYELLSLQTGLLVSSDIFRHLKQFVYNRGDITLSFWIDSAGR